MDKMTKEQAAELLTNYQQWRKGRVDYFPVSPAKLSQAIDLAIENLMQSDLIKAADRVSLTETQDSVTFCDEHMEAETVRAMYQFGLDHAGSDNYLFAIMADFANSRINGK
jgi:hypothetical protein